MSFLLLHRRKTTVTPPPPPFSMLSLPNLRLWLDSSDAATVHATSGSVDQLDDKSGNGFNATATGTLRPVTGTRTVNGLNALDCAATRMDLPSGLFSLGSGDNTWFFVFASDNTGDATQSLLRGTNAGGGLRYSMEFDASNLQVQNRSTSAATTTQAMTRNTSTRIVALRRSGTTITPYVDGVAGTPGTNAENFTATLLGLFGNSTGTGNRFDGRFCEAVAGAEAWSDTNMGLAGNALATKWGGTWGAATSPSLDFSDSQNSMYLL